MAIQTFGDYGRWHPHLHVIVADGLFMPGGVFHVMPKVDVQPLAELFRSEVLKMLLKEDRISEDLLSTIMRWRYNSGFSVHRGTQLARDDARGQEALAQYILRNPLSVEKIHYQQASGKVVYRSKMTHGKHRRNFEIFSAEEFIARITQHIPEKSFQLVRYYGWYSNRQRGERGKRTKQCSADESVSSQAVELIAIGDDKPRKIPSPTWRECIKKVWEVGPLICTKCGGEMRIISFIDEAQVIRQILEYLGLWSDKPSGKPLPAIPNQGEPVYQPFDDGWGGYDEPSVTLN